MKIVLTIMWSKSFKKVELKNWTHALRCLCKSVFRISITDQSHFNKLDIMRCLFNPLIALKNKIRMILKETLPRFQLIRISKIKINYLKHQLRVSYLWKNLLWPQQLKDVFSLNNNKILGFHYRLQDLFLITRLRQERASSENQECWRNLH